MAFLDKTTLIVDAVLTDKGREKLSKNEFFIEKFALADDEIDYGLYDESNTNGPNFYGVALENMPILEAFTKADMAMKYKLTTLEIGDAFVPELSGLPASVTLKTDPDQPQAFVISPTTLRFGNDSEEYIFELQSDEFVDLVEGDFVAQKELNEPTFYPVIVQHVNSTNGKLISLIHKQNIAFDGKNIPGVDFDWKEAPTGGYLIRVDYPAPMDQEVVAVRTTGGITIINDVEEVTLLEGKQNIAKPFMINIQGSGQIYFVYASTGTGKGKSKDDKFLNDGKEKGGKGDKEGDDKVGLEKGDTK